MRKVLGVLTALVVSGSLISVSFADQASDVARVERELRAAQKAMEILGMARSRAEVAVRLSSLGRKLQKVEDEWKKFEAGEEVSEPVSRLREKREIYKGQMRALVKKMTRIFLNDEIKLAEEKKLYPLLRELKKLRPRGTEI